MCAGMPARSNAGSGLLLAPPATSRQDIRATSDPAMRDRSLPGSPTESRASRRPARPPSGRAPHCLRRSAGRLHGVFNAGNSGGAHHHHECHIGIAVRHDGRHQTAVSVAEEADLVRIHIGTRLQVRQGGLGIAYGTPPVGAPPYLPPDFPTPRTSVRRTAIPARVR